MPGVESRNIYTVSRDIQKIQEAKAKKLIELALKIARVPKKKRTLENVPSLLANQKLTVDHVRKAAKKLDIAFIGNLVTFNALGESSYETSVAPVLKPSRRKGSKNNS